MKVSRLFVLSIVSLVMVLVCFMRAHANLNLIGQGTSAYGSYNLIYDTDLNVTWYDYTNAANTQLMQRSWALALSVNFGGNVYDDWRLPITFDQTCAGWNCTNSEMGHLFYFELGNTGQYDTSGNLTGCGGSFPPCLTNMGDFQNLQASGEYWSDTGAYPGYAWEFAFSTGGQGVARMGRGVYALAVRPGLAVVPEPISSTLFLVGGAMLGFRRFRKKFKK